MKILVIVPARSGSKRIVKKNTRILGNKPLISWSIDFAKRIPDVCDILVSTDDPVTLEIAKKFGALAPWLRPFELATDTAKSVDVVIHALEWYESKFGEVDGVLLLQPTSPFRNKDTVLKGMELFRTNECQTVLGVSLAKEHPFWTFKLDKGALIPFVSIDGFLVRSQDLPKAYVINGSFYLVAPKMLKKHKSFVGKSAIPLITPNSYESLDIDTEEDWTLAEKFLDSMEVNTYEIDRSFS